MKDHEDQFQLSVPHSGSTIRRIPCFFGLFLAFFRYLFPGSHGKIQRVHGACGSGWLKAAKAKGDYRSARGFKPWQEK
jgi:hypothetical protein